MRFWGPWGVRQGAVGKTRLLAGTTWQVGQVMVAGAGPGTAGGRVLRPGTSVCCGVRVAAREQGEVVGGGSGQICGIKSEENVSAVGCGLPLSLLPTLGCPRSLLLSLLAWAARAARGLGAASSAEAQERMGLRKHPAGPSLALSWHEVCRPSLGPSCGGGVGRCMRGCGRHPGLACSARTPPLCSRHSAPLALVLVLQMCLKQRCQKEKTSDPRPAATWSAPCTLELCFLIGAPAGSVGTADTISDVQP